MSVSVEEENPLNNLWLFKDRFLSTCSVEAENEGRLGGACRGRGGGVGHLVEDEQIGEIPLD